MKSRMDKYYKEEELMQRTSKNDFLYDELYKEKQMPTSNVTVLDNINEIDITKIKDLVDSRENYKKVRDYSSIISDKPQTINDDVNYDFEEKDSSEYDINEIIKKKRVTSSVEDDKIRSLSDKDYEILSSIEEDEVDYLTHEQQLKDLFNTVSKVVDENDLFANLKDEDEKKEEESFYTNTSKIQDMDFDEDLKKENGSSKVFIIIGIIALILAISIVVYIKFIK